MKNLNIKKLVGLGMAGLSAVLAFASEMESQKKNKLIEELVERVNKLENK